MPSHRAGNRTLLRPLATDGWDLSTSLVHNFGGFCADGNKLRFEVNQDAARRAGLKLGSQLLKRARLVKD